MSRSVIQVFTTTSFALMLVLFSFQSYSQITVLDKESNSPIPGVYLKLVDEAGKKQMLTTDVSGQAKPEAGSTFRIETSCIGYLPQELDYHIDRKLTIYLVPEMIILDDVAVTAQYTAQKAENAVQKISIITQEQISAKSALDLRDLLSHELNIFIGQDQSLGSTIKMQGMSGDKVKILIDGVPIVGRLDGNIDLSQISLQQVERVEIVEGPLSVNYGTNALAGTINIITKKSQERKIEGSLNAQYENVGRTETNGNIGFKLGKNLITARLGRTYFDGFTTKDSVRSFQWKPKEQYHAGVSIGRSLKNWQIDYKIDAFSELLYNEGDILNYTSIEPVNDSIAAIYEYAQARDEEYYTTRLDNVIHLNGKLKNNDPVNFHVAYNWYQRNRKSYIKEFSDLSENLTTGAGEQDTTKFTQWNSRGTWAHTIIPESIVSQIGFEVQSETSEGARLKDGKQRIDDYAIFLSAEYTPFRSVIIRPGLRYSYNTAYDAPLTPSIHFKYGKDKWQVRASYGRGFRSPNLKDLYYDFHDSNHNIEGNVNLKAEISDNFQLSLHRKWVSDKWTWRWNIDGFYNNVNDLISLMLVDAEAFLYQNINIDNVIKTGARMSVRGFYENLTVNAGVAFVASKSQFEQEEDLPLYEKAPEATANLRYHISKIGSDFSVFFKYTGESEDVRFNPESQPVLFKTEAYSILDIYLSKKIIDNKLALKVGVKNLLDVTDISQNQNSGAHAGGGGGGSYPIAWGRNYLIQLKYEF